MSIWVIDNVVLLIRTLF